MDLCLIVTFYTRHKLLVWNKVVWELLVYEQSFFNVVSHSLLNGTVLCALCNQTPRERGKNLWCFRGLCIPACLCSVGQGEKHSGHHSFPDCSPYKREICFASPTSRITNSALAMPLTSTLARSANQKKKEKWTDIFGAASYHVLTEHSVLLLKRCLGSKRCVFKLIYKTAKSIFKIFHLYALFRPGFMANLHASTSHICNGCFFDVRKM